MLEWIDKVWSPYVQGKPALLALDTFTGHLTETVRAAFDKCATKLLDVQQCINFQNFVSIKTIFWNDIFLCCFFAFNGAVCNGIFFMSMGPMGSWLSLCPPICTAS